MDFGKDHYATVSWSDAPDNRRTVIGWMSNWQYAAEVPTMQFRSANTLPREMGLFKASDGQIYVSTVPSPEVDMLRDRLVSRQSKLSVGKNPRKISLPADNDGICEILLDIDSRKGAPVSVMLSNDERRLCRYGFIIRRKVLLLLIAARVELLISARISCSNCRADILRRRFNSKTAYICRQVKHRGF